MKKILLVGCGHMGSALLRAWYKKTSFKISVIDPKTYKILKKKYSKKISAYKSILDVNNINQYNVVIFAVKPQIVKNVILKINFTNNNKIIFISIVAGKKISFFKKYLNNSNQIIRVMPNLPALVEEGISCLVSNNLVSKKNKIIASNLFKAVGKIMWLDKESDIDKVTAISGSGPGYFFLFMEHIINSAIKLGIKPKIAEKLVYQTTYGSISLLLSSKKKVKELRKNIAIKGGTTEAAINAFEKNKLFKKLISDSIKAAYNRSKKIGNN